jgi:hypothetical protein
MELAHLRTPWYNVKVKHTFIEVADQEGNDCDANVRRFPRSHSDPNLMTESSDNLDELDFCDNSTECKSSDAQSTCSHTVETGDDDGASLSSSSSSRPHDAALSAAPVYGVFFASVLLFSPQHTENSFCARLQQSTVPIAASPQEMSAIERSSLDGAQMASDTDVEAAKTQTTITLKNVPADYTLSFMVETLDKEGFAGCYDFVHAPVDFTSKSSLGYVHVNLLNPVLAERACQHFHGFRNWSEGPRKAPDISGCIAGWSEGHQGRAAFIERYRNSPLMHPSVPQEFKPALFCNGTRIRFPAPTIRLKPPRVRHQKRAGSSIEQD